jgi:biopolymer transport protein ExbD
MNFRRGAQAQREEIEMNLVALIDVLLVTIIFLVVTTTYSKYSELQINLPSAEANAPVQRPNQIDVAVTAQGQYVIQRTPATSGDPATLAVALQRAAGTNPDPMIIINADANATHQSVVNVMEAARLAGFSRITFTTQQNRR